MKSTSPCPIAKDTEVMDIGHRKEDSDRVPVHEESLYSRLQKHSLNASQVDRGFCGLQRSAMKEESTENGCPLRLMEVDDISESNDNGDSAEEERGIPDLTAEVEPKAVDNINSSSYKKGHYSTNACDSIRLSSTSQVHIQRLHTAEPISKDICRSRDYHHSSSPVQNKENENDFCGTTEQANCVNKRSKSNGKRFTPTDERDDRKTLNEESSDDDSSSLIEEKKGLRKVDYREDDASRDTSSRSDDEYCDINSANVITMEKYDDEKEVESEGCENSIAADATAATNRLSVEYCDLNSEGIVETKITTEDVLEWHNSMAARQEEEEEEESAVMKSDTFVRFDAKSEVSALDAMEMDSRDVTEESGAANFHNIQIANYNSDLTGHRNVEDRHDDGYALVKKSTSRRKEHALDMSSKLSRKSQKRLSSNKSKSKYGILMEGDENDSTGTKSHGKTGKSKNKSTRSQRRDRQRSATADIGEADDDSGIQGDIYEFNEKESNLEDIGILSIIRRGKHESRNASSSISASPVQEMQCNDEYNKAEPPVLVREEPWPPVDPVAQIEHSADSNSGVQLAENCDESLQR